MTRDQSMLGRLLKGMGGGRRERDEEESGDAEGEKWKDVEGERRDRVDEVGRLYTLIIETRAIGF